MKKMWKCKDGRKVEIKTMTSNHIENAINVLRNWHNRLLNNAYEFADSLNGEQAIAQMDGVIARMEGEDDYGCDCSMCEWVIILNKELERRKIGK